MTHEQIEAGRSPAGGFSREVLAGWGVAWPPPKGWRKRLLKGLPEPAADDDGYAGPPPGTPEFDSRKHGLLAPPITTYRKQG